MPETKRERLSGWGNIPVAECLSYRPEKRRDLRHILESGGGKLIARGLGRSYGDAALQPEGVVRAERLNHFFAFDTTQGIVRAQSGVTLTELMNLSIPRGWLPPVIPGTSQVTLGGAFASNVHGKNHWRDGDFAEHVASIRLTLASGETLTCSPSEHSELFWATAGGMGMTGIIEEVTLRMKPIASTSLKSMTYRVRSTQDMIAAFEHYRDAADYMVGWIDHMAKGDEVGRGVFEAAGHSEGGAPVDEFRPLKTRFSIPFNAPRLLLNRYTMALYNKWRFKKYADERQTEIVDFDGFFHPLDAVAHWNRLYGRRGFFQYQCLLPETPDVAAHIRSMLSAIQKQGCFSFLAVLKYHRESKGYLTFPLKGYSIALDFPNTRRVRNMLPQIDRWIAERGGRIYLAKDALLSPENFDKMYPLADEWRAIIRQADPSSRFASLMSQRLGWKP